MGAFFIASEDTVGIVVISLAFIVAGYLALAGLFYVIVYRPSREERRARRLESKPRDREAGDGRDDVDPTP